MLKIIDYYPNTKIPFLLKKLEKFGFVEQGNMYLLFCMDILVCGVHKSNRKIYSYVYTLGGAVNDTFNIFDLIQAGLVEKVEEVEKETFEVPDYDNFMLYGNKFVFSNKRGTRKFYLWTAGNVHLAEVIDNGYCFKPVKEFINEPKSKESYEKARKICYDLYLDKEVQND